MADLYIVNQHGQIRSIPEAHLADVVKRGGRKATDDELVKAGLKAAPKPKTTPKQRSQTRKGTK